VDKASAQARCVCSEDTKCHGDDSGDGAGGPVCGNDWRDYPSACHVRKASCASGRSIAVKYRGLCGTWTDDNNTNITLLRVCYILFSVETFSGRFGHSIYGLGIPVIIMSLLLHTKVYAAA